MKSVKIMTGPRDRFRRIEEKLLAAGYRYKPRNKAGERIHVTPQGKLDLIRRGKSVYGLVLRTFHTGRSTGRVKLVRRMIPIDARDTFEGQPCQEIFSLIGFLEDNIEPNDAADSLRYALCPGYGGNHRIVGMDFASDKKVKTSITQFAGVKHPKSYKLTARECAESIDFYEIAKSLTRSNPIAVVHGGTDRGWVLVHRQFIRQSFSKNVETPIGAHSHYGYKMKYGDAWAFEFSHPREISDWKQWAKEVKNTPWGSDQRTYEVDYIEV